MATDARRHDALTGRSRVPPGPGHRRDDNAAAVSRETPAPAAPATAGTVFGERLSLARSYVDLLAREGLIRGLIGPREVPRLWDRHVLNCAVLGELIAAGVNVADVGSGAGLPGIPLALARTDLQLALIEPLHRRASFLQEVVTQLHLERRVRVVRGRAEDRRLGIRADVVVARAVAPLDRLATWSRPLLPDGGELLALKGAAAREEVRATAAALRLLGARTWEVFEVGAAVVDPPATVVRVTLGAYMDAQTAPVRRSRRRATSERTQ